MSKINQVKNFTKFKNIYDRLMSMSRKADMENKQAAEEAEEQRKSKSTNSFKLRPGQNRPSAFHRKG